MQVVLAKDHWVRVMGCNATFNNILVILVDETKGKHRPAASH